MQRIDRLLAETNHSNAEIARQTATHWQTVLKRAKQVRTASQRKNARNSAIAKVAQKQAYGKGANFEQLLFEKITVNGKKVFRRTLPEVAEQTNLSHQAVFKRWKKGHLKQRTEVANAEVVTRRRAEVAAQQASPVLVMAISLLVGSGNYSDAQILVRMKEFDNMHGYNKMKVNRDESRSRADYLYLLKIAKTRAREQRRIVEQQLATAKVKSGTRASRRKPEPVSQGITKRTPWLYPEERSPEGEGPYYTLEFIVRRGGDPNLAIPLLMARNSRMNERTLLSIIDELKTHYSKYRK